MIASTETLRPPRNLKKDAKRLRYYDRDNTTLENKASALKVADRIIREALEDKGKVYPSEKIYFNMPAPQRVFLAHIINAFDRLDKKIDQQFLEFGSTYDQIANGSYVPPLEEMQNE